MPSFGFSESTDIWIRPMPMSSSSLSLSSVKRHPFVVMPVVMPCPSTCFIAGMRSGWSSGSPPIRSVWSAPSSLILSTRARMSSIGTWSFELSYSLQYAQSRLHLYVMFSCAQIGRSSNARGSDRRSAPGEVGSFARAIWDGVASHSRKPLSSGKVRSPAAARLGALLTVLAEPLADLCELLAVEHVGRAELCCMPVLRGERLDLGGEAERTGERGAEGDHAVVCQQACVAAGER